jgi:hypothetical protein
MAMSTAVTISKPVKEILDQVTLIQLEPHIWSGRCKLRQEDLKNVDASDLPPADLATLGSKRKIDTGYLNVFVALKKRAERACAAVGVKFMGGFAVPVTKAADLAKELDAVQAEWAKEKADFLANYDTYVRDWVTTHVVWQHAVSIPTPLEYVAAAISFDWAAIQIREPDENQKADLVKGLNKQVNGLADKLFSEIADEASDILDKSFTGKDKVSQKALHRVKALRNKLHDLSFLNANVDPIVESLDHTLSLMPMAGHIDGIQFNALYGLLSILSNADRARAHGQSILSGTSVEDALSSAVLSQSNPTVSQPDDSDDAMATTVTQDDPVTTGDIASHEVKTEDADNSVMPTSTASESKPVPEVFEEEEEDVCLF